MGSGGGGTIHRLDDKCINNLLLLHFCSSDISTWEFENFLLFVLHGIEVSVSADSSVERSLKVTEAVITGCLQPAETLPGTTTSRRQLWLQPLAKRNKNSSSSSACNNLSVLFTASFVVRVSFRLILVTIPPLSTWRDISNNFSVFQTSWFAA